jgi:hypothetical protein
VQWTADGATWLDVWLSDEYPKAARVGVFKTGFREPLYAVARWDSYVVTKDEWKGGAKTGNKVVSDMWAKMPDLMLGKVAEMLALRKAFPQDLSGLYSTEEMQQAAPAEPVVAQVPEAPQTFVVTPEPTRDWVAEAEAASTLEALTELWTLAPKNLVLASGEILGDVLKRIKRERFERPAPEVASESAERPRDFASEARAAESRSVLRAVLTAAEAASQPMEVLRQIASFEESLPAEEAPAAEPTADEQPMWNTPLDDEVIPAGQGAAAWGGDRG